MAIESLFSARYSYLMLITSLGNSGEGVGSEGGLKVFVPGALPGEEVDVAITERKVRYAHGKLLAIRKPSPERTVPPCPLFGTCGGCQIMHLKYEAQLDAKRTKVQEALRRIGHLDVTVEPTVPSPHNLFYRNKIQLPIRDGMIGLFKAGSHEIVPVKRCLIQQESGNAILTAIKPLLTLPELKYVLIKNTLSSHEALVVLVTEKSLPRSLGEEIMRSAPAVVGVVENLNAREDNVILGGRYSTLAGRPFITETLLGLHFRISAAAFFQVNPLQAEQLYRHALSFVPEGGRLLDAYCGVGTLALLAAKKAQSVTGIECIKEAVVDAAENARCNGISNARFCLGKAEDLYEHYDCVLLNPPRKGCDLQLLEKLGRKRAQNLIYISCDPATLARDLALLTAKGYHIKKVTPFDMFPQTMHVETVVILGNAD